MKKFFSFFGLVSALSVASACNSNTEENCAVRIAEELPIPYEAVQSYRLVLNKNIPANKMGAIVDAAGEWSTASSGAFAFEVDIVEFNQADTPELNEMRVWMGPDPDPASRTIGQANWWPTSTGRPGRSIIWIQDDLSPRTHYLVALHEIGHAVGLLHNTDELSIMQSTIADTGEEPQCVDRQSLCSIWACDPRCE